MKKTVIIISGGIDSTTLAYYLKDKNYDLYALTFDYGQKQKKEISVAETIADKLKIPHMVVDISSIQALLKSALTTADVKVPHGSYKEEVMKATVVPNRNAIFLSIAAGYAGSLEADNIAYAAHAGDHFIYPDCRPRFTNAFNGMLAASFDSVKPVLLSPFIKLDKSDIVRLGSTLGVPFELTYSCYEGREKHCGECGTCVERKEAFKLARVEDPTKYVDEEVL